MNFIKHFIGWMDQMATDDRLTPHHVSLYVSLFSLWNLHHFRNPISIARQEVMQISKIGSVNTYLRCLKQLHQWGYLKYEPSYNPLRGSKVYLYRFDNAPDTGTDAAAKQVPITQVRPSLNYINNTNHENIDSDSEPANTSSFSNDERKNEPPIGLLDDPTQKEKVALKRKRVDFLPPDEVSVKAFFQSQQYPEMEAQKFFNYFQSNGWKVGGRASMQDWQAAARNWMLNANKYRNENTATNHTPSPRPGRLDIRDDKDYEEPL
jgi:hypothetical protein